MSKPLNAACALVLTDSEAPITDSEILEALKLVVLDKTPGLD